MKHILISLSTTATLMLSGCGGGGSGDTTPPTSDGKKITGTISGNGFARNDIFNKILNVIFTPAYAVGIGSPDKIVVMFNKGQDQREFNINADGSFEIDTSLLSKDDLVILVVNSINKSVFGHLKLETLSNQTLDYIDKSKLTDDLDMGNIDTENNCSSSVTLSDTTSFTNEDLAKMEKIALSDNALILYQNKYKNPDYYADIQALYNMDKLYGEDIDNIKGVYSPVDDFNTSNSIGFRPTIKSFLTDFDSIDENNIFIYPPSNVNFTVARDGNFNQTATTTTPITATYKSTEYGNFYEFGFVENFPTGDWLLKITGSTDIKGSFIYSAAYPYDTNGKSIVPVPSIKLNMDETDTTKLKSIDVKWYVYNGTSYEQVDDDYMNAIASQDIAEFPTKKLAPLRNASGQDIGLFFGDNWNGNYTLNDGSSVTIPTVVHDRRINMSYNIGQVSYQFLFQ